jgi:hypothetical protein
MKALSIKQPWVHAILHEGKDLENRSKRTSHRGWIALHASGTHHKEAKFPKRIHLPEMEEKDYSAILGVARIVDVVEKSRSPWFYRPDDGTVNYGWVLEEVKALPEPIPCKGKLGLWDVAPADLRKIKKQLPGIEF